MLLTTQGRRSGVPRTVALTFFREGPAYVVVASNAGEDADPAWWLNLKARPEATVNIGGDESSVVAREARGEERESLWRRITASEPSYAAYQRRTARRIPIVVLEPRGTL
jgi:deazaflavin-dependent oxidoreductase (nitroreductase family)